MKKLLFLVMVLFAGLTMQAQKTDNRVVMKYYKEHNITALKKEAQAGHTLAMEYLSHLYDRGSGVAKNPSEGFYWLKKAAETGELHNDGGKVAERYYEGNGVAKNLTEAFRWWKKTAEAGNTEAMYDVALCYYKGEGTSKSIADAIYWWMQLLYDMAEMDIPAEEVPEMQEAMWKIAGCFWEGNGVEKSYKEAVKWWKRAARAGHELSQKALKTCNETW